jgi:hypothetical protein
MSEQVPGASASADQALIASDQAPACLGPSGFDPSRIVRPRSDQRVAEFEDRLFSIRWIADRVMAGQQFNCFEAAGEWEDEDEDEDREYSLCIGPITDARYICGVEGRDRAEFLESAMKVATEIFLEKIARDSDRSGEAGETRSGSTEGKSPGPDGIAKPVSPQSQDTPQ